MIVRNRVGRIEPMGALAKTLTTDFPGGVVPSWLTVVGIDAESTTPPGGVRLDGVALSLAGAAIDLTAVAGVKLTASYTGGSPSGTLFKFGVYSNAGGGAGGGALLSSVSATPNFRLRAYNTGGGITEKDPAYEQGSNAKRYHVTVWIDPTDRSIAFGEGPDQVAGAWRFTGSQFPLGTFVPKLEWLDNGADQSIGRDIHQMSITTYWL